MTNHEMLAIVQSQLATDLNCTVADLNGEKDSLVFVEAKDNPGRIPFRRGKQHFDMLTMGGAIIVSATPARLQYAREQLTGKSRDDAFETPFIRGHSIWYMPDLGNLPRLPAPGGFAYDTVEGDELPRLREASGFSNAVQYDDKHPIQNTFATLARQGDAIAAIAGAFVYSSRMWAIGIDVLPEHRSNGLAAYLVNALAGEILNRGIVPCYGTTSSNIASQKVAHRAGFMPAWMCDHRVRFEGELSNS
jgi:GNAT superfamily N-acetyltransferase